MHGRRETAITFPKSYVEIAVVDACSSRHPLNIASAGGHSQSPESSNADVAHNEVIFDKELKQGGESVRLASDIREVDICAEKCTTLDRLLDSVNKFRNERKTYEDNDIPVQIYISLPRSTTLAVDVTARDLDLRKALRCWMCRMVGLTIYCEENIAHASSSGSVVAPKVVSESLSLVQIEILLLGCLYSEGTDCF